MEKVFNFPKELQDSTCINIFYGTGIKATKRLKIMSKDIKIDYIGDNDEEKWGTYIDGILCISHEEIRKKKECVNLIIGSNVYRKEIYERMLSLGLMDKQIFYDNYSEEMDERSFLL